jgi:glycosyltransferase involved in cell wall biosynthesis
VTLEDMTLRQASSIHPVFNRMSPSVVERWEEARAEIYDRARMCAVASHWAADSLRTDYGVDPERIAVVGFGANHGAPSPLRDWSAPRFLFVGVEWERKGGPLVLRAFRRVRELHPDATLDVVGGHPPLQEEGVSAYGVLSQQRTEHRELVDLFARATCVVMPSLVEPFGIVHVEAASTGIPSIGSSVGGPADVLGEGAGVLVAPGDEEGLLRAMLQLADSATARAMGEVALERSRLYTWKLVAERLLRALEVQAPDGHALAGFL